MYRTVPITMPISVIARLVLARLGLTRLGQAEVEELGASQTRDHHVFRLQVAVQDAERMRGAERVGNLRADLHHAAGAECPLVLDHRAQAHAVNELGDQIVQAVLVPGVVDDDDPRVIQRGDDGGFTATRSSTR